MPFLKETVKSCFTVACERVGNGFGGKNGTALVNRFKILAMDEFHVLELLLNEYAMDKLLDEFAKDGFAIDELDQMNLMYWKYYWYWCSVCWFYYHFLAKSDVLFSVEMF